MGISFKLDSPISLPEEGHQGNKPLSCQNVIILTDKFHPTQAQLTLLNKGLTYIPTIGLGKFQKKQLEIDLQTYHRKIKLAAYFRDSNSDWAKPPPFTPPSTWTPPDTNLPIEIKTLIEKDKADFKKVFRFGKETPNLTKEEVKALQALKNNKHIVIKPADKGSSVVIMGRDQYIFEVERQLKDKVYYRKLKEPMYLDTVPLVHSIIDTLKDKKFINNKQKIYLKGDKEPRTRRFYILPKIHKDPNNWTIPNKIPQGRPIVSDCGSETYFTAEYIDYFLNPLSVIHPSYVKDTYHFIETVKSLKIPTNSFFFTADVESLYTNIDITAGIEAVKNIFRKHPNPKRPDKEILKLLEINLTRNDFIFNGEFYLQIKGTAMGKKFAPSYANIFMANWEEKVFDKCSKKPLHYLRYLDDLWGIWCYSEKEFIEFMDTLNAYDPSIKLKHVINHQTIDFLDTTVYKGPAFHSNGSLDIKVFFKQTDTHALLFKTSFHPTHTFRGLVKSQLLRFFRICTQKECFWESVRILFGALRKRGYTRSFLKKCLSTFQTHKQTTDKHIIPLITKYSTMSRKLNRMVKNNYQTIIDKSNILTRHQIISAYKKNKNLRDILVRAKLDPIQQTNSKPDLDGFSTVKYVRNRHNKQIFVIDQTFTPLSTNCVYMIYCFRCGKQYIGETSNSIRTRMWQHRYNIKKRKEIHTPLVKHFLLHGLQALRVAGIQGNSCWTHKQRKSVERQWIYKLQTKEPLGLNISYF